MGQAAWRVPGRRVARSPGSGTPRAINFPLREGLHPHVEQEEPDIGELGIARLSPES
jgi:hypothetical protein